MKELKILVRRERVHDVIAALRDAGVPRLLVSHVHALGTGVDPEDFRLSLEEGAPYTEKVKVEVLAPAEDVPELVALVQRHGRTGRFGDGLVIVSDVETLVNIRTGDESVLALR